MEMRISLNLSQQDAKLTNNFSFFVFDVSYLLRIKHKNIANLYELFLFMKETNGSKKIILLLILYNAT